jgi:hypothetical protein
VCACEIVEILLFFVWMLAVCCTIMSCLDAGLTLAARDHCRDMGSAGLKGIFHLLVVLRLLPDVSSL